jgi:hypothetical protein
MYMPVAGFEPAITVSEKPQTHALDRTVTVTGSITAYTICIRTSFHMHDVKAFRGVKERLHTFFISTQDRHEWSLSPLCSWGRGGFPALHWLWVWLGTGNPEPFWAVWSVKRSLTPVQNLTMTLL